MSNESYEEWKARENAANAARQTNPPTQPILFKDPINYDDGTEVQWVCACGCVEFEVFYVEGYYSTFVICPKCNARSEIHSG